MKKLTTIVAIRLSPAILSAADRAAKAAGTERATLFRRLICEGLGIAEPEIREGFGALSATKRRKVASEGGLRKAKNSRENAEK